MELMSRMKMTRFQTFWMQMRKNKPLDECRKTSHTSGTKMTFHSYKNLFIIPLSQFTTHTKRSVSCS
ncbi:hypothetical protein Hanom_Chr17g01549991 [Helianthus anomalus]